MTNPYTQDGHYLNLFGYTVKANNREWYRKDQYERHRHAYKYVHRHFTPKQIKLEPAKLFLLEAAKPDKIPAKEEFDNWKSKREIVEALK